jgi:hypothetical protein
MSLRGFPATALSRCFPILRHQRAHPCERTLTSTRVVSACKRVLARKCHTQIPAPNHRFGPGQSCRLKPRHTQYRLCQSQILILIQAVTASPSATAHMLTTDTINCLNALIDFLIIWGFHEHHLLYLLTLYSLMIYVCFARHGTVSVQNQLNQHLAVLGRRVKFSQHARKRSGHVHTLTNADII